MMTQKERLVELLKQTDEEYERLFYLPNTREYYLTDEDFDFLADYLLNNGVIILPVVFGNFYMPFEKDFDYGTLRAFADNRQAQDYLIGEEKA